VGSEVAADEEAQGVGRAEHLVLLLRHGREGVQEVGEGEAALALSLCLGEDEVHARAVEDAPVEEVGALARELHKHERVERLLVVLRAGAAEVAVEKEDLLDGRLVEGGRGAAELGQELVGGLGDGVLEVLLVVYVLAVGGQGVLIAVAGRCGLGRSARRARRLRESLRSERRLCGLLVLALPRSGEGALHLGDGRLVGPVRCCCCGCG